jgi:thiamine kinase-like enzyme
MNMIPVRPDQMTLGWLEQSLGAPVGALVAMKFGPIGTGQMCDSFRLCLDWENHAGPATIIAKCPSQDQHSRNVAKMVRNYELEISWYQDLAEITPINCPQCFHAQISANGVDFALLLDDRAPAKQGDQLAGADTAMMSAAIIEMASLHAAHWNSTTLEQFEWLQFGTANKELVRTLLPALYTGFRERYLDRLGPGILDMGQHLVDHIDGYLDTAPAAFSVVHGDFRLDNLLFLANPDLGKQSITVVDWQTVGIGSPVADLAYFIGTCIADPDIRAAVETELFEQYCGLIEGKGVTLDRVALWRDYRRYAYSGFIMAIFASMNVERTERGDEMFAVMAERPAKQILHLNSAGLLG